MRLTACLACALFACASFPCPSAHAQTPARQHCSVQTARPLTEADHALMEGHAAAAEGLSAAQLASTPSTSAYASIIRAQLQQNKLTEALASGKAAVGAFPNSAETYSALGDVLIRLGEIPEASLAFSKALSLDQCSPRAHLGWGRVNGFISHRATETHELAAAHMLAPADSEITAAWVETLPLDLRAAPLTALLASTPALAPDIIQHLATELAIDEQHKLCLPSETIGTKSLELQPIPFRGTYTRSWALKVTVNSAQLPLVELDSSVNGIILNPKDALKAGVRPIGPPPTSPGATYTAIADHIKIGSIEYHDCPVRVASSEQLAGANSLIGIDFFRDNIIHIDYAEERLNLSPLPPLPDSAPGRALDGFIPPTQKNWTPVYVTGSTVLVPTLLDKKGPFLFLLDTGSWSAVMSPSVVSQLLIASNDLTADRMGVSADIVRILPHEGGAFTDRADILGADGTRLKMTRPLKLPVISFANNSVEDDGALSFDLSALSHSTGLEVSGMFGFRILQQYAFDLDYRDGLVHFVFDQNRRYAVHQANKHYLGNPF